MPETRLDAAILHGRSPEATRVAFFAPDGPSSVRELLPAELAESAADQDIQILLPTTEQELAPIPPTVESLPEAGTRIAPGLWTIPSASLPLESVVPWLASLDRQKITSPTLRMVAAACRLVATMAERREFTAPVKSAILQRVPRWTPGSLACLSSLAEIMPGCLLTAREAVPDDPVYASTARNILVAFCNHALNQITVGQDIPDDPPNPLPREFWRPRPVPVLEILTPDKELEEGVPWAIQLRFRPIAGVDLFDSLEHLEERHAQAVFSDPFEAESLRNIRKSLDDQANRLPVLRRTLHLADGKASLNRQELDAVLDHIPMLQAEGFEIRLPGLDRLQQLSARVSLLEEDTSASASGGSAGVLGEDERPWFQFKWQLALDDRVLSEAEFQQLLDAQSPLVELASGPVLLSPKDRQALEEFKKRSLEEGNRISFFEALRLRLGGATHLHGLAMETVVASPRLDAVISNLEQAREVEDRPLAKEFLGELRPYQSRGHSWLHFLVDQGFGACLADDMGLGKTVQAIAVMLDMRNQRLAAGRPKGTVMIVCPVSVLGNWRRELTRFSPALKVLMHHGKQRDRDPQALADSLREHDIVLTSYNLLQRDEEILQAYEFAGIVLDEAQNIKNPTTKQSQVARQLKGGFRIALTGTPLENRPLDLWSIMDFLNEGLLGSRSNFVQTMEHPIVKQRSRSSMSALAQLVRPFVLRRLKTDPEIITDLPDKTEQVVTSTLSREQAILYEKVVRAGLDEVEHASEGIQRRGAILTTLLRLKQVCNHPAHYLLDGSPLPNRSGKLDLLSEMLTEALDEGDRCLVFTQFKEMGSLLKAHLEALIGEKVFFLHGGVPQKDRDEMVAKFQEGGDEGARIFVLSLKAGGTGLNLTQANRVFHYDRWWNPAVEDQATDRAFRIGQQRNVFVHKFVCTGTLEERIQAMLERKREVAEGLLGAGENWITELSNEELRKLLALDRTEAVA